MAENQEERALSTRSTTTKRMVELDSLRGLAALSVVFLHLKFVFNEGIPHGLLVPVFSGQSSVILFFVLSGYVLSLPYWNGRNTAYTSYLTRRFCRIYLPFLGALALAVFAAARFHGIHSHLSDWYATIWAHFPTWKVVVSQLTFWPSNELNTAFWSLRYEMQMSLVFPALCWIMRKLNPMIVALPIMAAATVQYRLFGPSIEWHFLNQSLYASALFLFGAVLSYYREPVSKAWRRMGRIGWAALGGALYLYWFPSLTRYSALRHDDHTSQLVCGLGSCGIIVAASNMARLKKILTHWAPEYLGRISYSLYLVHIVAVCSVVDTLHGKIPNWALVALALISSFLMAHLFCIFVEEPSARLGKQLTQNTWNPGGLAKQVETLSGGGIPER